MNESMNDQFGTFCENRIKALLPYLFLVKDVNGPSFGLSIVESGAGANGIRYDYGLSVRSLHC